MTDVSLIEIHNATIWRGNSLVFDGLTLRIDQHEPTVILGPNGSGKTTLLKVIMRELYPVDREGSWVRILGRDAWNVWELRSHIGVVSDDLQAHYRANTSGLDVVLSGYLSSVGVHGSLASRISRTRRAHAADVMSMLGVGEMRDKPLAQMSTGQQRRCLLARALVHDPDTLILDEPTAGLDLAASFDYLARIRRLVEEGRNIVLVTHLLNEIPPEIGRVILLRGGVIVADGRKDAVLTVENLRRTYSTDLRLATVHGYYVACPPGDPSLT
ncbi:MAG: ATP-binding cassette domain-containing protein [Gammaproteobacteria bacterium]|nr:ATP-binding cassette domain-containing protein [Gammaproteobacteria bacterium]MDH5344333.1 ATP-binding cassette domain-containing protein [Gammaproteobacteria bacterium]